MQTDAVFACNIENNDHIVVDGEVKGYVYMVDEDDDFILLDVVDDDGEHTQYPFGPFDTVTIVTRFDDEEIDLDSFDFAEWAKPPSGALPNTLRVLGISIGT